MDKIILKEIGLTKYEAEIYLTLLQFGHISAYQLAKKTGLYRQACYDALNRLIEKGFVSSVKEGKNNLFMAIDPKLILEYLNEKTEQYKNILPNLIKLTGQAKEPLVVETYRGKNITRIGLRDVINTLKESGGENLCTSVDESVPIAKYKTTVDQYERDILKYKIKERVIIKEGSKGLLQRGNSTYRKISSKYFNPNPVQIYGDNVQIIIWGNPDYLIIMRSKEVADSFRKQFEFMWLNAR